MRFGRATVKSSIPPLAAIHDDAERIREWLLRRHQELRESMKLSMYALWLKCGVSRDTISRVEGGETILCVNVPTLGAHR